MGLIIKPVLHWCFSFWWFCHILLSLWRSLWTVSLQLGSQCCSIWLFNNRGSSLHTAYHMALGSLAQLSPGELPFNPLCAAHLHHVGLAYFLQIWACTQQLPAHPPPGLSTLHSEHLRLPCYSAPVPRFKAAVSPVSHQPDGGQANQNFPTPSYPHCIIPRLQWQ